MRGPNMAPVSCAPISKLYVPDGYENYQVDGLANLATTTRSYTGPTVSATPSTKGAWVQVIASTPEDINGLWMNPPTLNANASINTVGLDIGVGGAGSEVVVAPDLFVGGSTLGSVFFVPVFIPKGSRIAWRAYSGRGAAVGTQPGIVWAESGPTLRTRWPKSLVVIGKNATLCTGTTLSAPGSFNTKGAWTNLGSPTTTPLAGFIPMVQIGDTGTVTAHNLLVDFGIQVGGVDIPIINNLNVTTTSAEVMYRYYSPMPVMTPIPTGAQFRARYQWNLNAATPPSFGVLGIPAVR